MRYRLEKIHQVDVTQDPVRPELSLEFRTSPGREMYALKDEQGNNAAVICVCYTKQVPTTVFEMEAFTDPTGSIAIAYTVWSNVKGAGKTIIDHLLEYARNSEHIKRVVTLSPLTLMAKRFHTKNGAIRIALNKETQNFEYSINDTRWETALKKAKKWFNLHRL
jgi:hypothetical protein